MYDYRDRIQTVLSNVSITDVVEARSQGSSTCPACGGPQKFSVWENRTFKCWRSSCSLNKGGDVISLFRALNPNLTFNQVIRQLESLGNISYEQVSSYIKERSEFFSKCLQRYTYYFQNSSKAVGYMESRGFSKEVCLKHQIGYAPYGNPLKSAGLSEKQLDQFGMLREGREYYTNRIIFPIFDQTGHLVHFTGRYLGDVPLDEEGEPKLPRYKDSQMGPGVPGTKSYLVFENLLERYDKDYLVIAEGYPDSLTLLESGLPVVGLLGLEKLVSHGAKLAPFKQIIAVFDSDIYDLDHPTHPGEYKSWIRVIPQLVELQLLLPNTEFCIWMVPQEKDINDWVLKSKLSSEEIRHLINSEKRDLISALIEEWGPDISYHSTLLKLVSCTGRGKEELVKFISPILSPLDYALRVLSS